jgi:hyperosmotically inducible protein
MFVIRGLLSGPSGIALWLQVGVEFVGSQEARMQKAFAVAVVVVFITGLVVSGVAQSTDQSLQNQQAAGAQAVQAPATPISPEAQAKLARAVYHAIIMLPYYEVFDYLNFTLQGRTVTLEGAVLRATLKPDAERAVKKVEGVEKVINNIVVLPPSPMDDQIRQSVYRAIYNYGPLFKYKNLPNPPIRIIVQSSRVTLEGVVDNENDKNLCTIRVNQLSSVLSVTNDLRVVKP